MLREQMLKSEISNMIYEVVNPPKRLNTAVFDSAVSFACSYLRLDVDLTIEFDSLPKYHYGDCDYDEGEVFITIAKRLSTRDAIRTLFHELVHAKQYNDGRLGVGSPQRWLGVPLECEYLNSPWEIEAFDLEERMMKLFYGD